MRPFLSRPFLVVTALVTLSLVPSLKAETGADLWIWADNQKQQSRKHLLAAIHPAGTEPGAVVACPTKVPNDMYFKHWIRDSALTMNLIVSLLETNYEVEQKTETYGKMLVDFSAFSRHLQTTPNLSDAEDARLGEPLFFPNGTAYPEKWGRPQNDGAALRAITLTRWAMVLLKDADGEKSVREKLYDSRLPAETVIKADLEYISHLWDEDKGRKDSSFDLWEEIRGQHFYTKMVQRKALIEGEKLARKLKDTGAADWYKNRARLLEAKIIDHWRYSDGFFYSTIDREGGIFKKSGLDSSIVLAVLHGDTNDNFMPPHSDRVIATAYKIAEKFREIYDINRDPKIPGIAIGRYPEDQYDGVHTGREGSPWVLLTNAYAEWHYRMAKRFRADGEIRITKLNEPFFRRLVSEPSKERGKDLGPIGAGQIYKSGEPKFNLLWARLIGAGDNYLWRVKYHARGDGSLSEQMNRRTGEPQGASDLAWSHASFLTAVKERETISSR